VNMRLKLLNKSNQISRLVLGTAQLGMNYGIANRTGQPDFKTAESIVKIAWESGIREFDTAQAYGESEKVLGHCLSRLGIKNEASIISKTHPNLDHLNLTKMQKALETSLSNVNRDYLYGYLLHREELLDQWDKGLEEILVNFVEKDRLVKNIGVSVYSPERAIQALKTDHISIVQLPSNVLDRRFENAGVFELADRLQKTVYVRSVFLQGLLLMDSKNVPKKMQLVIPVLEKIDSIVKETGLSRHELALGYAKKAYPNAKIVFGVETQEQLKNNLKSWERSLPLSFVERGKKEFNYVENKILNPVLW
jgi:aryl-alcohol dehydrogenase-like predicted oxidoreductase